CQQETKWSLTF
nr:immunoglobulin light chain junction region [Macaca mulatta]